MSGRLREVARRTVEIAESGEYVNRAGEQMSINDDVMAAVAGTRLYLPGEALPTGRETTEPPTIEVTEESTLEAAARLGDGAATLVFASAKNPGGGFLGGAKAQEESIARSSALYPCLLAAGDFYAFHRQQHDLRYSDRVIYSPDVPVFRDDGTTLLDRPYRTSFITAAAPNLGAIAANQPEHTADVPQVLRRRAVRVLRVAAAHGHRTLVLGAWGCGVFRNDPSTVANAFAEALREVPCFTRVVFAVYDRLPGAPVRAEFASVLLGGDADVLDTWQVHEEPPADRSRRRRR